MATYYFVGKPNENRATIYFSKPTEEEIGDQTLVEKEFDELPYGRAYIVGEPPDYLISFYDDRPPVDPNDAKIKLQSEQIKALSERNEFLEDCIAEMAGIIYNSELAMPSE